MSLEYRMLPNNLVPNSFRADVVHRVVDTDEIVREVALRVPSIDASLVRVVVDVLRDTMLSLVSEGKSPKLDGFLRIFPSIPGNYGSSVVEAEVGSVRINSMVSTNFERVVKGALSLSRVSYVERVPIVTLVVGTNRRNYLGDILIITGDGLLFFGGDSLQGVFVINTNTHEEARMVSYARVTNGQIIGLNNLVSSVATGANEYIVNVRARYTSGGSLRNGGYVVPVRCKRRIVSVDGAFDDDAVFDMYDGVKIVGGRLSGVSYENPSDEGEVYNFALTIEPRVSGDIGEDSLLRFVIADLFGDSEVVYLRDCYDESGNPVSEFVFSGLDIVDDDGNNSILEITIALDDVELFYNSVADIYRGSITEVVELFYTNIP